MSSEAKKINLLDEISSAIPRERGGPSGSKGYDFQKAWAAAKILQLYQSGNDFLVILDYHEDIIILDSPETPSSAKFYQIKKKKSGYWTANALSQKKDAILDKLFSNSEKIKLGDKSFFFSSNSALSVTLIRKEIKSTDCESILFSEIDDAEIKTMIKNLSSEHSREILNNSKDKIVFEKSNISPDNMDDVCVGKFASFFEDNLPHCNVKAKNFYRTLLALVKNKTNYEYLVTNPDILLAEKSVSKKDFLALIKTAESVNVPPNHLSDIINSLEKIDYPLHSIVKIKEHWKSFYLELVSSDNLNIKIREKMKSYVLESKATSLNILLIDCLSKYKMNRIETIYDDEYLTLVIVYAYRF